MTLSSQQAREAITRDRPSPAVEAVLALVVEQPGYTYLIWKRFEKRFGHLYPVGKPRIYQVVDQLVKQGLVEALEDDSGSTRQPKIRYRATAEGARRYREWIAGGMRDDPRREELLRRLLSTGVNDARTMLSIIDTYERAYLDDLAHVPSGPSGIDDTSDSVTALRDTLIDEERRLTREAQLRFITFARRLLRAELEKSGER
jgi:DNA-binding PadR family transcriptional regulator